VRYLVVADVPWVRNEVRAALSVGDVELIDHDDPETAAETALANEADAVIVDLQVASMGGMAVARAVRNAEPEEGALPVVLLLDRAADVFLAGRAGASGWVVKPFTAGELRGALEQAIRQPAS
jgi:DNA-binding response OmpR family regulator